MSKKYYSQGRFYCHKCKQDVNIYPIPSNRNCLRFQIHNDEICRYYKLLNEGSNYYADAEFLTIGGEWKKYECYNPLSHLVAGSLKYPLLGGYCPIFGDFDPMKPFAGIIEVEENEKQYFQCMNCRHQSDNFYDFIPYY